MLWKIMVLDHVLTSLSSLQSHVPQNYARMDSAHLCTYNSMYNSMTTWHNIFFSWFPIPLIITTLHFSARGTNSTSNNKNKTHSFQIHASKIRLHLWNKNDKIIYLFLQRKNLCLMTLCSFLLLKNSVSYDKSNSISYFLFKTNYVLSKMLSSSSSHVTHIFTDHHAYYTK